MYKISINKVDSDNPEDVRFGKYCYLFNDKIYTSPGELPIEALAQLKEPIPEIEAEEIEVDDPYVDCWTIIYGRDISINHIVSAKNGNPGKSPRSENDII